MVIWLLSRSVDIVAGLRYLGLLAVGVSVAEDDGVEVMMLVCCLR